MATVKAHKNEWSDVGAALEKAVSYQCELDTPKKRLMFAIFKQAIDDVIGINPQHNHLRATRQSAVRYLSGSLWNLEMIGCNPEYVKQLIRDCGLDTLMKPQRSNLKRVK